MKAVGYKEPRPIDHPDALVDIELPEPLPSDRDILVEVRAVSVNPVDTKIRRSTAATPGEFKVLGWDAAGVVRAVGNEVTLDGNSVDIDHEKVAAAGNAEGPRYSARFVTIRTAPKPSQKLRRPILVASARHRHCRANWTASRPSQASMTIKSSAPAEWVSKYGFICFS